jgi:oxygen-independent coproporphyrinogen-3 oxidase
MARDGLVDWDGYRLAVKPAGRPFVRNVAAAFDTWLRPGAGRHSAAV